MNKITLVNKRTAPRLPQSDSKRFYCGRGSPVGNPFISGIDGNRETVCRRFDIYFKAKLGMNDQYIMSYLNKMLMALDEGDIELECFCTPKQCHTETIRDWLINFQQQENQAYDD